MRRWLEPRLLKIWYQAGQPPWSLRQLAKLYQRLSYTETAYSKGIIPTIVVGNITAGGTGKTPLVIHLVELLRRHGFNAGVVARGYGRSSKGNINVQTDMAAEYCGDEPLLIKLRTGAEVWVGENRQALIEQFAEQGVVDCVIADDGLQNRTLGRDIEICMLDGHRALGNGHLLPAGPLREPAHRLQQVDFVISKGPLSGLDQVSHIVMQYRLGLARSLNGEQALNWKDWAGQAVDVVTGISNPNPFIDALKQHGLRVSARVFSDHYQFSASDFTPTHRNNETRPLLMTEKDAVKCRVLNLPNAWYIPLEIDLPATFDQALIAQLTKLLEKETRA